MDRKDLVERKTEKGKLRESKVDHIKLQKRWEVMEYRVELEERPQTIRDRPSGYQKGGGEDE